MDTESNGKGVTADGRTVLWDTSPVVWGEAGTDGQHAFYQLLHQGTRLVPADFLVAARNHNDVGHQHEVLLAHCFAQTKALMEGRTTEEARRQLLASGADAQTANRLAPAKTFPGNRPSNTFLYKQLTPRTLGTLLALYEHKIFVQGILWRINSFDQMGVELGKQLADDLLPRVMSDESLSPSDGSTEGLLRACKGWR